MRQEPVAKIIWRNIESKNSLGLYVKWQKQDLSRSSYHETQLICSMSSGGRIKQKNENRRRRNNVRGLLLRVKMLLPVVPTVLMLLLMIMRMPMLLMVILMML